MPHQHGFLFHFNDVRTGEPFGFSEVSSIDTAIFICGVLTCRAYFNEDSDIKELATALYDRVEWPWMLNGGDTFSMGWRPSSGFIRSRLEPLLRTDDALLVGYRLKDQSRFNLLPGTPSPGPR